MNQPDHTRPSTHGRSGPYRRLIGALGVGMSAAILSTLTPVGPANADGVVIGRPVMPCDFDTLYKVDSSKGLLAYGVNLVSVPGAIERSVSTTPRTASSSSAWKTYTKIFGGPEDDGGTGYLYAIDSSTSTDAAKRGLYLWTISDGSVKSPVKIDTGLAGSTYFSGWSKSKNNLITSDANGDIYTLSDGLLRRFVVDRTARTLTRYQHLAGKEWKDYDLIVAGGVGQLFARTKAGQLYEYNIQPDTERWLSSRRLVGSSGWDSISTIVSPGSSGLYAVTSSGALRYYSRGGEDSGSFARSTLASSGWSGAVLSTSVETCAQRRLFGNDDPAPLQVAPVRNAAVSVLRTPGLPGSGTPLRFAFTTNVGQVFSLDIPDEAALDQLGQPALASGAGDYYVGSPALAGDPQQKASVLALRADGHVGRGTLGSTDSWAWADKLGVFPHPVTAVQVTSKAMAVFGVDAEGSLWLSESLWKANSAAVNVPLTALGAWRKLSAPPGGALTGEISSVALASGSKAAVVARAADGRLYTATYAAPTETGTSFSSWTALPEAATVGSPSLTVAPGDLLRIAARTSSGSVVTLGQTTAGFPTEWTQIAQSEVSTAENSYELAGNPGVVFNPADGRVTLFSRTTDGSVLAWQETAQGCGTFSEPWTAADSQGNSAALVADPVPFVFSVNNTYRWGFASYDADFKVTLVHRSDSGTGGSGTCSAASPGGSMSAQSLRVAPSSPSVFTPPTFEKSVASAPAE